MSIRVNCPCGKQLRAKDEAAGTTARCPQCGKELAIPWGAEPPVEPLGIDLSVKSPTPPELRPFWKDPVIVIGGAVPVLILAAFFIYLALQRSQRVFEERVIALKAEADRELAAGRHRAAFGKYEELLTQVRGRLDLSEKVRGAVDGATVARDNIAPGVLAQIQQEEDERRRQEEEAEAATGERERIRQEQEKEKAEAERLARFQADVMGGAWSVNKAGHSEIIRGLDVFLIPEKTSRGSLGHFADYMTTKARERARLAPGSDSFYRKIEKVFADMAADPPEKTISVLALHISYRVLRTETDDYDEIVGDRSWLALMSKIAVATAKTNIEGKFKMPNAKGGRYLIYAMASSERWVIEWLVPVEITKSGEVETNLFNDTATLIVNRKD